MNTTEQHTTGQHTTENAAIRRMRLWVASATWPTIGAEERQPRLWQIWRELLQRPGDPPFGEWNWGCRVHLWFRRAISPFHYEDWATPMRSFWWAALIVSMPFEPWSPIGRRVWQRAALPRGRYNAKQEERARMVEQEGLGDFAA